MRLILPDALSEEERAVYDSYLRWIAPGGVCVNVMVGSHPWDIRPVVLEQGRVWLYRFTPSLSDKLKGSILAELEGFAAMTALNLRVKGEAGSDQIAIVRPFVHSTLADSIRKGELDGGSSRLEIGRLIIDQVGGLIGRNLVHGHLSLSNVSYADGAVLLLDPRIGLLSGKRDSFCAPEISSEEDPPGSADIFGLGKVLKALLEAEMSDSQRELVDRMVLPSQRHRPSFSSVRDAFSVERSGPESVSPTAIGSGRMLSATRSVPPNSGNNAGTNTTVGSDPTSDYTRPPQPGSSALTITGVALLGVALLLGLLRYKAPNLYFDLAHFAPFLAAQHSPEFEGAWESGDKNRMRQVARAAALDHDPAAENTIINDIMNGGRPQFVSDGKSQTLHGAIMRVAFNDLWKDSLSREDERAVINLTVAPLVSEAMDGVPPLRTLHPAVILAVASQVDPLHPSQQLVNIPLDTLATLPEPVGPLFAALRDLGTKNLVQPEALGLAAIVAGQPSAVAIDAYIGRRPEGAQHSDQVVAGVEPEQLKLVLARLALVLPLMQASDELAGKVATAVRDQGGPVGQALSWFDIEDLARWAGVKSGEKLRLVLGQFPERALSSSQYADLLLFPLGEIRRQAASKLKDSNAASDAAPIIDFLATDQNRLTREQNIALIAAFQLEKTKRAPFLSSWFTNLKPDPNVVLRLLLAHTKADTTDLFNLESARYLKRTSWNAPLDLLTKMASHPEPLARSLAYSKLDPAEPTNLAVLKSRLGAERDPNLQKSIMMRLESRTASVSASAPDSPSAAPSPTGGQAPGQNSASTFNAAQSTPSIAPSRTVPAGAPTALTAGAAPTAISTPGKKGLEQWDE